MGWGIGSSRVNNGEDRGGGKERETDSGKEKERRSGHEGWREGDRELEEIVRKEWMSIFGRRKLEMRRME